MPTDRPRSVADVCRAARVELAATGSSAHVLVTVVGDVERLVGEHDPDALADPVLVLDLLDTGAEPAVIGRVLDYLRQRGGNPATTAADGPDVRDAIGEYERSAFLALSPDSRRTYKTWLRRLADEHGDRRPREVTSGDLVDLIAQHAPRRVSNGTRRRVEGVGAARTGVSAFRHLWADLARRDYADARVAQAVPKPPKSHSGHRRAYKPAEAALVRQLAASGRDPMLDLLVVLLAERALLRRGDLCRLRLCDLDFDADTLLVWGKGDRADVVPMTPGLAAFLREYVEQRRPRDVPADAWARSTEALLRRRPTEREPQGRGLGSRYVDQMLARFRAAAPELFADGAVGLHTFRHTAASWLEAPWGRSVAQAALRHRPDSPSAHYFPVPIDQLRAALTAYEDHVLSWRDAEA